MLKNLVGLVTGGASGLGKATASALAKEGCKVTICDLPDSDGKEVARSLGPEVNYSPTDVRSETEVERMFEDIMRFHKRLDFIVNCAGIAAAHKIYNSNTKKTMSLNRFKNVFETNVVGSLNCIRMGVGHITKNAENNGLKGVIVNTAGVEAFDGQIGQAAAAAAAGAIASMTLPLARDLGSEGIRVVCLCPGVMDTPLTQSFPDKVRSHISLTCASPKRFGMPEEFAHAVKFILENPYVNGCCIRLDAGMRFFFA